MSHLIFVSYWPKEATLDSSNRPRRSPRLVASAVALVTATSLALSTSPTVSAQQLPSPQPSQTVQTLQTTPPSERTDTTLPAAPLPSDAMPLDEPPARASAMARQSPGTALSQEQWNRRPVAQRGQTPQLEPEWRATDSPNREVTPGEMRSDREEIPAGFTKAEADKAETMEAALAGGDGEMQALAAPGCQVYWPAPYEVCGAIRDKYNELGGPNSFLLFPKTNEITNPDGVGKRTEFLNGPIYWSPQGGAHPVVNHFLAAWARHGYENSYIGYPTTDEIANPDGIGRRQHFTGSTIYWYLNEAYSVGGAIADKWHALGAERADGLLGYPISDEKVLPDGVGRMNRFQNGVIYWHPTTGAQEITGEILDQWSYLGYEQSEVGYPVGPPTQTGDGNIEQSFQHGVLRASSPAAGVTACSALGWRAALQAGMIGLFNVVCSDSGVWVQAISSQSSNYFTLPSQRSETPQTARATTASGNSIQCNDDETFRASGPRRSNDGFKVTKTVKWCVTQLGGRTHPEWRELLTFEVSNTLDQRVHHRINARIADTGFPAGVLEIRSDVRQDRNNQPDASLQSDWMRLQTDEPDEEQVDYEIEEHGTFFVEFQEFALSIPSRDFTAEMPYIQGFNFTTGRFNCDPYDPIQDGNDGEFAKKCQFTNPVDDHL